MSTVSPTASRTASTSETMNFISALVRVPEWVSKVYGFGTSRSNFRAVKPISSATSRAFSAYISGVKTSSVSVSP